jgi:lipopolysaccharide export system protein LptA
MSSKKIQILLFFLSFLILGYTYLYLPTLNKGSIEIKKKIEPKTAEAKKGKSPNNTFLNTEYKNTDSKGQIYTTQADQSFIYQDKPDIINLVNPYSFTTLKKDNSLVQITSKRGVFDKENNITSYTDNVIIKNKNYLISANSAQHISSKNIIIINGNVIMKDLTMGLSNIAYSDTVEIDTLTNNAVAFMKNNNTKVIAKKIK